MVYRAGTAAAAATTAATQKEENGDDRPIIHHATVGGLVRPPFWFLPDHSRVAPGDRFFATPDPGADGRLFDSGTDYNESGGREEGSVEERGILTNRISKMSRYNFKFIK